MITFQLPCGSWIGSLAHLKGASGAPHDLDLAQRVVAKARHYYFPRTGELVLPNNRTLDTVYGQHGMLFFLLPGVAVAIEDPEDCVLLCETHPDQRGLMCRRWFMHVSLTDAEKSVIPPFKDQRALFEHLKMLEFFDGTLTCTWGFVERVSYTAKESGAAVCPVASAIVDHEGSMAIRPLADPSEEEGQFLVSRVIRAYEEIGFLRKLGAITILDDRTARAVVVGEKYKDLILPRIADDYFSPIDVDRIRALYERGALLRRRMDESYPEFRRPPQDGLAEMN